MPGAPSLATSRCAVRGPQVRAVHGSPLAPGGLLAGEAAYLFRRDTEHLLEVSGKLVGAKVAVLGDDLLDVRRGQRRVLQPTATFLEAQPCEQLHRREVGGLEYLVQVAGRDFRGCGASVRVEFRASEMLADDAADACQLQ